MNAFSWDSANWGKPGHNVHRATSGTWADAEPEGDES